MNTLSPNDNPLSWRNTIKQIGFNSKSFLRNNSGETMENTEFKEINRQVLDFVLNDTLLVMGQ